MRRNNSLRSRRRTRRKTTRVSRPGRVRKSVSRRRLSRGSLSRGSLSRGSLSKRSNTRRNVSRKKTRRRSRRKSLRGGKLLDGMSTRKDSPRHEGRMFHKTRKFLGLKGRKLGLGGLQRLRKHAAYSCRMARMELDQIKNQLPQAINGVVSQCKLADVKAEPARKAFEDVLEKALEELYQETNKAAIALGGNTKETIAAFNELMPEAERLQKINNHYSELFEMLNIEGLDGGLKKAIKQKKKQIDEINDAYEQEVGERQKVLSDIDIEGVGQGAFAGDIAREALKVIISPDQTKKDGDMDEKNHLYYHKLNESHEENSKYILTLKDIEVGGKKQDVKVSVKMPAGAAKEKIVQINYQTLAKKQAAEAAAAAAAAAEAEKKTEAAAPEGDSTSDNTDESVMEGTVDAAEERAATTAPTEIEKVGMTTS